MSSSCTSVNVVLLNKGRIVDVEGTDTYLCECAITILFVLSMTQAIITLI